MEDSNEIARLKAEITKRDERIKRLENEIERMRMCNESAVQGLQSVLVSMGWMDNPLTDVLKSEPTPTDTRVAGMMANFTTEYGGLQGRRLMTTSMELVPVGQQREPSRKLTTQERRQLQFGEVYGDPSIRAAAKSVADEPEGTLVLTHPDIKDKPAMLKALLSLSNLVIRSNGPATIYKTLEVAIDALYRVGAEEIIADMQAKRVPWNVKGWSDLSEHTDVNFYALLSDKCWSIAHIGGAIGETEEAYVQSKLDLFNVVQAKLANWLEMTFDLRCMYGDLLTSAGQTLP